MFSAFDEVNYHLSAPRKPPAAPPPLLIRWPSDYRPCEPPHWLIVIEDEDMGWPWL